MPCWISSAVSRKSCSCCNARSAWAMASICTPISPAPAPFVAGSSKPGRIRPRQISGASPQQRRRAADAGRAAPSVAGPERICRGGNGAGPDHIAQTRSPACRGGNCRDPRPAGQPDVGDPPTEGAARNLCGSACGAHGCACRPSGPHDPPTSTSRRGGVAARACVTRSGCANAAAHAPPRRTVHRAAGSTGLCPRPRGEARASGRAVRRAVRPA